MTYKEGTKLFDKEEQEEFEYRASRDEYVVSSLPERFEEVQN